MKRGGVLALIVMVAVGMGRASRAAEPAGRITVVSHVDIIPDAYMPQAEEKAAAIFRAQLLGTQRDMGLVSYVFLRQVDAPNHFTIIETWMDSKSYAAHEGARHTIEFRNQILPYLGSPFDARVHTELK